MSSRLLSARTSGALRTGFSLARATPRRSISGAPSLRHKESAIHGQDAHEVQKHKDDSVAKQKSGEGHWKSELASDSEAAIKADRDGAGSASKEDYIKSLQERSKKAAEDARKAGTSTRDGA